jgi:hypothetical protein
VLLALAAAGLIVGVHELVRVPNRLKHMGKTRTAAELRYRAERAAIVVSASARALASRQRLAEVQTRAGQPLTPEQQSDLDALQATLDRDAEVLDELEWKATTAERERDLARTLSPGWQTARRWLDVVAAIAVIGLVPFLVSDGIVWHVSPLELAVLLVLAVAAVAAAVLTYLATDKIVWFGVVAFLAVGVLFCATSYYRTKRYPKVESVAVLVRDRPPRVGFLVARTSDTLYIGTFRHGSGHQRVLAIPQERVTYAAIGPLVGLRRAERRALGLALDLCRQWVPRPETVTAATPTPHRVCSLGRRARIDARLARWHG